MQWNEHDKERTHLTVLRPLRAFIFGHTIACLFAFALIVVFYCILYSFVRFTYHCGIISTQLTVLFWSDSPRTAFCFIPLSICCLVCFVFVCAADLVLVAFVFAFVRHLMRALPEQRCTAIPLCPFDFHLQIFLINLVKCMRAGVLNNAKYSHRNGDVIVRSCMASSVNMASNAYIGHFMSIYVQVHYPHVDMKLRKIWLLRLAAAIINQLYSWHLEPERLRSKHKYNVFQTSALKCSSKSNMLLIRFKINSKNVLRLRAIHKSCRRVTESGRIVTFSEGNGVVLPNKKTHAGFNKPLKLAFIFYKCYLHLHGLSHPRMKPE